VLKVMGLKCCREKYILVASLISSNVTKSFGSSESSISCVNPVVYADRFVELIDRLLV